MKEYVIATGLSLAVLAGCGTETTSQAPTQATVQFSDARPERYDPTAAQQGGGPTVAVPDSAPRCDFPIFYDAARRVHEHLLAREDRTLALPEENLVLKIEPESSDKGFLAVEYQKRGETRLFVDQGYNGLTLNPICPPFNDYLSRGGELERLTEDERIAARDLYASALAGALRELETQELDSVQWVADQLRQIPGKKIEFELGEKGLKFRADRTNLYMSFSYDVPEEDLYFTYKEYFDIIRDLSSEEVCARVNAGIHSSVYCGALADDVLEKVWDRQEAPIKELAARLVERERIDAAKQEEIRRMLENI